ncbi:type VI secretion system ImpA family N-terminal domain-containing protein [Pigmentibacter sp. JX0631]|uniref:type VI secretion system protein TssA n=1 Tax=Pigmentibacter sp. JX0631 TaxID=2976982 RepID=UPI002469A60C|nr:type VI secretion system ImpA family N-terminal domain-containing protein [Pigmentibacter sp. JX0631]WGL59203.1 type VI secretion system ImpA family N-terminal domain-containing protein [Pigmentibacter sp. JX0631]
MNFVEKDKQLELANLDKLMAPISSALPCGEYLKRNSALIQIKELRTKLIQENDENQGIWVKKQTGSSNWGEIVTLSLDLLLNQTKDLNLVTYLLEAQFKIEGFVGLAKILSLFVQYCNVYWDDINPPIQDQNFELRAASFKALRNITLLGIKSYSFQIQNEQNLENITWSWFESQLSVGKNEGIQAKNKIIQIFQQKSDTEVKLINMALESILKNIEILENEFIPLLVLDEDDHVTFEDLSNLIQEIYSILNPIYLERLNSFENKNEKKSSSIIQEVNEINTINGEFGMTFLNSNSVNTIQEAYNAIEKANEFLLKNDPHSPSPYLIRRALEWRKKSLYSVLLELFSSTTKPQEIFSLLGLSHLDKSKK